MPHPLRTHPRGGLVAWLLGTLVFTAAASVLAWMLLLPAVAQSRFSAATGAPLRLQGLAADPFSGRASVTGWALLASDSPGAPVLARGGPSTLLAPDWHRALQTSGDSPVSIDLLDLHLLDARLAPDPDGHWPLLALAAASGLPYERGGPVGDQTPRIVVKKLRLRVDTILVRDAATGLETPVHLDWRGEFHHLDHTRPVVAALLAAARSR